MHRDSYGNCVLTFLSFTASIRQYVCGESDAHHHGTGMYLLETKRQHLSLLCLSKHQLGLARPLEGGLNLYHKCG